MVLLAWAGAAAAADRIDVAVTFDDMPAHGPALPGQTRLAIFQSLLAALKKHHVPQVYGFVNGVRADSADGRAALKAWLAAGYPLASHTFSHPDLKKISLAQYLEDVDKNEPVLRE